MAGSHQPRMSKAAAQQHVEQTIQDYRERYQAVVKAGNPRDPNWLRNLPLKAPVIKEVADTMADQMGVDPNRVHAVQEEYKFQVGDHEMTAAGTANHMTGQIKLYMPQPTPSLAPILAHEMMHVKFQAVKTQRDQQFKEWFKDADPEMTTRAGFMTPKAKEKYPIAGAFADAMEGESWPKLVKDDGISDYSREWWQAWHDKKAKLDQAMHETLAEMAKLDWEGVLDRLIWYKESTTWKPLYEAVNKYYQADKDDRV